LFTNQSHSTSNTGAAAAIRTVRLPFEEDHLMTELYSSNGLTYVQ